MDPIEAIEFAIEELESLLLAANSGAYEDDEDRKRCEEAVAALKKLVEEMRTWTRNTTQTIHSKS